VFDAARMRKRKKFLAFLAVSTVATALLLAPATTANAALHSRHFKMPSRNIHCAIFSGNLRCDIMSGLKPEPQRDCELDWTGLILVNNGKASPVCAGDTVRKEGSPTLEYGTKWKRNKMTCTSKMTGLRCRNEKGHGFFLSRDKWRKF
jgi:hypothetical protein